MKLIMENWKRYTQQTCINESLWDRIKTWMYLGAADANAIATGENPDFIANQLIDARDIGDLKGQPLVDRLLAARREAQKQQAAHDQQNFMYDMAGPARPDILVDYLNLLVRAARIEPDKTYAELFPALVLDRFSRRAGKEADEAAQQELLTQSKALIKQISGWLMIGALSVGQVLGEEQTKRDK